MKETKRNDTSKESLLGSMKLNKDLLIANNIKDELNKLFYAKPNYKAELQMLKYQYSQEEEERIGLHASAITNAGKDFCYREQVISLFFKQSQGENIHIGLKRIFEEGKSIGTKWQRLFIRGEVGIKEDMDVSRMADEYDLSYTPDATIELNNKHYVVEIKSQNTFAFKKQKGHPSGTKQLKLYLYFESKRRDLAGGFVLVDDKNDQDFKILLSQVPTKDDPDISKCLDILEEIQRLKRIFIKKKKPPERVSGCDSSSCKRALNCNMREACWGIRRESIK